MTLLDFNEANNSEASLRVRAEEFLEAVESSDIDLTEEACDLIKDVLEYLSESE